MKQSQITWLIVIVLAIALAIGLFFALQPNQTTTIDLTDAPSSLPDRSASDASQSPAPVTQPEILVHRFTDGVHMVTGSLQVPTPCHALAADVQVLESAPEQIRIDLMTTAPDPDIVCTQVSDHVDFTVEYVASQDASIISLTRDGNQLDFEVFEESKG